MEGKGQKIAELKRIDHEKWQVIYVEHDGWMGVAFNNKHSSDRPIGVVMVDPKCARELATVFDKIAKKLEEKSKALGIGPLTF